MFELTLRGQNILAISSSRNIPQVSGGVKFYLKIKRPPLGGTRSRSDFSLPHGVNLLL